MFADDKVQEIPTMKQEERDSDRQHIDFFGTGMDDDNDDDAKDEYNGIDGLQNEFDQHQVQNEPFGMSINREQLQASKKEIEQDMLGGGGKRSLQIDIDENEDYDTQNSNAQ